MTEVANLKEAMALRDRGAWLYIGHSAGKDSMAMYEALVKIWPADRIKVIHADLGEIEYEGNKEFIRANIDHELMVAKAYTKDGAETDLFDMIRRRRKMLDAKGKFDAPAFPSSAARFCTSDLKTGPIWREIRRDGHELVINCVGIRAEESKARAKKIATRGTLNLNKKNTTNTREAYDWWPIAHWTTDEVWWTILDAGKFPHKAYGMQVTLNAANEITGYTVRGNERLSCVFCIFGSANDLRNGAKARPELLEKYVALEKEVRGTMFHGASLLERIEVNPNHGE